MSKTDTLFVIAAPGRTVPLQTSDAIGPGVTRVTLAPGDVREVPNSTAIRRRVAAGDLLVLTEAEGKKRIAAAEKAAADAAKAADTTGTKE